MSLRGWVVVVVFGLGAFGIAFGAAQPDPGVTVDSGEYLSVAEGLSNGHGLTMPYVSYDEPYRVLEPGERVAMTQFPPLYPVALASLESVTRMGVLDAATWLGSSLFLLTVVLAVVVVARTAGVISASIAGALFLAPDVVSVHAMAWSEPLMILPTIAAAALMAQYVRSGRIGLLVSAGICASLASLARFAGVAFLVAGAVVIASTPGRPPRRRIGIAALWLALGSAPVVLWYARNTFVVGIGSEKQLHWHPPGPADLARGVESIGRWIVPGQATALIAGLVLLAAGVAVGRRTGLREPFRAGRSPLPGVCAIFGLAYFGFLIAYRTLLDENVAFDVRILSPLHALAIVGVCATAPRWRVQGRVVPILLTALAVFTIGRGVETAYRFTSLDVVGYTGDQWRASETLDYVGALPDSVVVVTNTPDALWLWQRRAPLFLPPRSNLYTGERNDAYVDQLRALRRATGCRRAVVVFFERPTRKKPRHIDPRAVEELQLERIGTFSDGVAYEVGPAGGCRSEGYLGFSTRGRRGSDSPPPTPTA